MKNVIISIGFSLVIIFVAPGATAQTGFGPQSLSNVIDNKISQFIQAEGIVGMTVAVTQKGRLVYSKGFGHSILPSGTNGNVMTHKHRSRIGSVSKAIVSGPATWVALDKRGKDPKTTKIYGANGLLGSDYSHEQRISNERFRTIITIAIKSNDKVFAWYRDGTYSVGNSADLSSHRPPRPFQVAEGKSIHDLHAVAINSENRVYAWYKDGSRSIGTPNNLGSHSPATEDEEGKPRSASFPVGLDGDKKSMHDVVGIGISKSEDADYNSAVYVWYDDGTVSAGTSMNFSAHYANRTYSIPGDRTRYRIRGIGIASDDDVYTWTSNNEAMAGWSRDLDSKRSPYNYTYPVQQVKDFRFNDITVQHLFDHKSGFHRSGDVDATRRMYGLSANDEPSYSKIHRHFLATRPLKSRPGETYSYSNHGMGLTTLLIPAITGKSYREYAEKHYLKSISLESHIRPQTSSPGNLDSYSYWQKEAGGYGQYEHKDSTTGLAAGGWTSSAQGLLAVTTYLADKYGYDMMDDAGFGNSSQKLSHTGSLGGGYSRVNIFTDNYTSPGGRDLRDIHIAVAINTSELEEGAGNRISTLTDDIVKATADANIPNTINYWPQAWD